MVQRGTNNAMSRRYAKIRSTKFSRSRGSLSRPSSSSGSSGNRVARASAKSPRPDLVGTPLPSVHLHPLETARRRILLEHESTQLLVAQLIDSTPGIAVHDVRLVLGGLVRHQTNLAGRSHQPHRFAWRAHAGLHFRAHRHPLNKRSQRLHQKGSRLWPPSKRTGCPSRQAEIPSLIRASSMTFSPLSLVACALEASVPSVISISRP